MRTYKLYHIRDAHFVRSETFEAEDEQDAVRWAQDRIGDEPAELWCQDRKVAIFPQPPDPTQR